MSKPRVVLISGIPGGGKSGEAARLAQEDPQHTVVIAVNDFFLDKGKFHYVHMALPYAQDQAKAQFVNALLEAGKAGTKVIIVEDIFSTVADLTDYVMISSQYGCVVEIITMECDPATAIARQLHDMRPGYIVCRDRDLRARVIPEAWNTTQRAVKVPSIEYPAPIE